MASPLCEIFHKLAKTLPHEVRRPPRATLCQQGFHYVSVHIRQAVIAAFMAEREPFMIHPHRVQKRGMQIVNVDRIPDNIVAEIVRFPVNHPLLDSAAGHPHSEATRMVVPSKVILRNAALTVRRPAEFAAPNDQRFIKKTTLF